MKDWVCEKCENAITGNGGIALSNENPKDGHVGGYPRNASPDFPDDYFSDTRALAHDSDVSTGREVAQAQAKDAMWYVDRPVNIGIRALHYGCTGEDFSPYWIDAGDVTTLERWIAWVLHLQEKSWIGHWDTVRLMSYWWHGHGLERQSL